MKRRPAKRWEDDINANPQPARTNRDNTDFTIDTTWLTGTGDPLGSQFVSSRLKQPTRPTTPINTTTTTKPTTHEHTTHTTKAHYHNEGGPNDDHEKDGDASLLILFQFIDC